MRPGRSIQALGSLAACVCIVAACGSSDSVQAPATTASELIASGYYLYMGADEWRLQDGADSPAIQPPGPQLNWFAEYRQELRPPREGDRLIALSLYGAPLSDTQEYYKSGGTIFTDIGAEVVAGTVVVTEAAVVMRSAPGGTLSAFSTDALPEELIDWFDDVVPVERDEWVAAISAVADGD